MEALTSLEAYNSIFNIFPTNNSFELCTDTFDKFSFGELKDELEEILKFSDITPSHVQYERIGPRITEAYQQIRSENSSTDGYIIVLLGYTRSPFRDFESSLRIVVGLDEDDVQLILKQHNSNFVTYELSPGIYSIEDYSNVVYRMGDHEGTFEIEYDDISMKMKLTLTRFGSTFGTLIFDEKFILKTLLGFTTFWD